MSRIEQFHYDNRIVRAFGIAAFVFALIGMLVGLILAFQLIFPDLNLSQYGIPYTSFGRLRPLHTNAVIFAFIGNGIFMGVYYSLQRLLKTRMFSDTLSWIHFWGWQIIILLAAVSLPAGLTTSSEYAELIWPIDVLITIVWVVFGINMFGTILKRRENHLYVAIWFYIATWVTVAVLHIVRSFELPYSLLGSYPLFAGVQDALVQWWYGHNAVAFFLTTPYLGIMYYFLPKAANRPVYSYRLSIIHFWALIFIYIWAGPHHLLYSAMPDWVQSLGTVFSVMLIAPSWGGMLNGLLTLRGAWDRVRQDPVLKFFVVAVTAYGMATFEGPMLSVKSVNAISHFTDWTIAHAHVGALGWNGFLTFGMLYWLWPRMYRTQLYSTKLANVHFWMGTLGIIFYAIPMYWSGWTQSLMWKEFTAYGTLAWGNFLDTVLQIIPMYAIRALGGTLYFVSVCVGVYNLYKTAQQGSFVANEAAEAPARQPLVAVAGQYWHKWLEGRPMQMLLWSTILISIGGIVQIIPMVFIESQVPKISTVKPYTPLELAGRDIYIREGCVNCHSQLIRPFRSETERYGEYSKSGEFIYDRPFLWGSKRTGPDLHREGGKYPDRWHYDHMIDPRTMSPGSIMPQYPLLAENELDLSELPAKIAVLRKLGTPYPKGFEKRTIAEARAQAREVAERLRSQGVKKEGLENKEIVALIAYLQRLGTDIKVKGEEQNQ
ncbi:MAG: cytochrome-c oxidase, cbb3-type subunit I [Saprospiraceae bacterium]|nr:cytochrome-c oxidase, cbb3-type subunit I [Saprospiraceae bacterium]MDW8483463.1 cytochrome-c oxidase, cbb3-type subunit I [Saprospiraceae bacterium]